MPRTPQPDETLQGSVAALWQAVFGLTGTNGLRGDCKECRAERKRREDDMSKRLGKLEIGQARLAVLAGVGSGLVVTLGTYLLKLIGG